MSSIVLSYPGESGVCAEQICTEQATESVKDSHWRRTFYLCRTHAVKFDALHSGSAAPNHALWSDHAPA